MKLAYDDIIDRHKNKPCVVSMHGPSLSQHMEQIESLQRENKIIRISVNEWFDFFSEKPDYWVVSNTEFTIKSSVMDDEIWQRVGWPKNVFNHYSVPLIYNRTADHTTEDFIKNNLNCDFFSYDTKHFKGHNCQTILNNFKNYYMKNKNLNFLDYGNNPQMWQKPNVSSQPEWYKNIHGKIAAGWSRNSKCCSTIVEGEYTLQEKLQQVSGYQKHMGTGQTVGMVALMLAVLFGCNPIYIAGMDLDYSQGYADRRESRNYYVPNQTLVGHWITTFRDFLLDDMKILKESAALLDTNIVNLNEQSWYDVFAHGNLKE